MDHKSVPLPSPQESTACLAGHEGPPWLISALDHLGECVNTIFFYFLKNDIPLILKVTNKLLKCADIVHDK